MRVDGIVWRQIPFEAEPLDFKHLRYSQGRWNRRNIYACLYTALTPRAVAAEYRKHYVRFRINSPRDLVSMEVAVDPVLDLTARRIRDRFNTNLSTLTGNEPRNLEACRRIADRAKAMKYQAILAPSAAIKRDSEYVLAVYVDGPAVAKGPDREPLNYGPDAVADRLGRLIRSLPSRPLRIRR